MWANLHFKQAFEQKVACKGKFTAGKNGDNQFFQTGRRQVCGFAGLRLRKGVVCREKEMERAGRGYFSSQRNIKLVIQLVDMRHPPTADDINMIHFLLDQRIPFIIAMTKCDKLNKTETEKQT